MSKFFLVRNFLSVKTASAIIDQYSAGVPSIFSIEADNEEYFKKISSAVRPSIKVIRTEKINWLFEKFNYITHVKQLFQSTKDITKLFKEHDVTELFVNYPVHEKDALYVKVARRNCIKVSFYEEGSCFYTGTRGRKADFLSELKFFLKNFSLALFGIHRGYNVNADHWYSLLPIKHTPCSQIFITYNEFDASDVKFLFLSRPVTLDFPSISLEQHILSIRKFADLLPNGSTLHIKFHPRETASQQCFIISSLADYYPKLNIEIFGTEISAEDVVFNMPKYAKVCGFDSSTLIYGPIINPYVKYLSVLKCVYQIDNSGELSNLYSCYSKSFLHIEFL